jgi:hypothetical protein
LSLQERMIHRESTMKAGMFRTSSVLSNSEQSLSSEIFIREYISTLSEARQQERGSRLTVCCDPPAFFHGPRSFVAQIGDNRVS